MFSFRTFVVLGFMLRFVVLLELIFMYDARYGLRFFFFFCL